MAFTVFGSKPKNSIFLGTEPYALRNDCACGQWKVGDDDFKGNQIQISIIKVSRYFGSLGKAKDKFWLQIWFVPAPDERKLPSNTVCVTYLKTRSISRFSQKIIELMEAGEPALGVFAGVFEKHTSELGTYYSVGWGWRERKSEEEFRQLDQIEAFLSGRPPLVDYAGTRDMISLDGLNEVEIQMLIQSGQSQQSQVRLLEG